MEQTNDMSKQKCNPQLAIVSVPCQTWNGTYQDMSVALDEGTIFPELNMPFYMGGNKNA